MDNSEIGILQFTEWYDGSVGQSWKIKKILESVETPFQKIDLYDTASEGKLLVHDGAVMLTERFEHCYHEMIVHPPMLTHPKPERVMVIGGGDGGTLREIVKHPEVKEAVQYEIDGEVVRICKKYFPEMTASYDHPKVKLFIEDGIKAMEEAEAGSYDVILMDSVDPVGPAVALFEKPFYEQVYRVLADDGVMVTQVSDYHYNPQNLDNTLAVIRDLFPMVKAYRTSIPMYPSGEWCFIFGSKGPDPLATLDEARSQIIEENSKIWNRDYHRAAFAFPNAVKKQMGL